jgi:hypothetical protein
VNLGLVALLVLVPLLQIPAVLYLSRYLEVEDREPIAVEFRIDRPETPLPAGVCRDCGATNDPEYTFCRSCVAQLR